MLMTVFNHFRTFHSQMRRGHLNRTSNLNLLYSYDFITKPSIKLSHHQSISILFEISFPILDLCLHSIHLHWVAQGAIVSRSVRGPEINSKNSLKTHVTEEVRITRIQKSLLLLRLLQNTRYTLGTAIFLSTLISIIHCSFARCYKDITKGI